MRCLPNRLPSSPLPPPPDFLVEEVDGIGWDDVEMDGCEVLGVAEMDAMGGRKNGWPEMLMEQGAVIP